MLVAIATTTVANDSTQYLQGGAKPFPPALKAKLDAHAPILSLGINSEWIAASDIDEEKYIEAIHLTATAVERGEIPGAVIYADRIASHTIPVAIGYQITDPQRRKTTLDTCYDIGDLTGPLITNPLVLVAVMQGKIKIDDSLGFLLPELSGSDKSRVTVEQLLRHSSGLPSVYTVPPDMKNRADVLTFLRALRLDGEPGIEVRISALNEVLLGLVLEKIHGKNYSAIVEEEVLNVYEMKPSSLGALPDHRAIIAPGEYSALLGRMVWAEPSDPIGIALGADSSHTGFVTYADALANLIKGTIPVISLSTMPGAEAFSPVGRFVKPSANLKGGEHMGAGVMVGKFGKRSYGWDAESGCSVWILPDKMAYIIFLSNYSHPSGLKGRGDDCREKVLPLLADSLRPLRPSVDTHGARNEPLARHQTAAPAP